MNQARNARSVGLTMFLLLMQMAFLQVISSVHASEKSSLIVNEPELEISTELGPVQSFPAGSLQWISDELETQPLASSIVCHEVTHERDVSELMSAMEARNVEVVNDYFVRVENAEAHVQKIRALAYASDSLLEPYQYLELLHLLRYLANIDPLFGDLARELLLNSKAVSMLMSERVRQSRLLERVGDLVRESLQGDWVDMEVIKALHDNDHESPAVKALYLKLDSSILSADDDWLLEVRTGFERDILSIAGEAPSH